jgi:DNA polymerase I-like protein with 3'-5' exonuclease and polymerase domains
MLLHLIGRTDQLYGLYVKSFHDILTNNIDCKDGRIRPSFWGVSTRTGRCSASNPNVQQTIKNNDEDELASIIRGLFTCDQGNIIVKLDIIANEVRGWGSVSKDKSLHQIVIHGKKLRDEYYKIGPDDDFKKKLKLEADLHYNSAGLFYQIPIEKVTKDMRQDSKVITFGTIYGLTDKSLAVKLKKEIPEVVELKKRFFGLYKQGKRWLVNVCKFAKNNLYVENPMGRRRRLYNYLLMYPLFKNSTKSKLQLAPVYGKNIQTLESIYASADRRAMNSPIQALGSDIAVIGSFLLQRLIEQLKKNWKTLNVVHDSNESEIPVTDIVEFVLNAKVIFERLVEKYIYDNFNYRLYCPIEVEFEIGFSMNAMVKWDGSLKHLEMLQEKFVNESKHRPKTQLLKDVTIKL